MGGHARHCTAILLAYAIAAGCSSSREPCEPRITLHPIPEAVTEPACFTRPLRRGDDGLVDCVVYERAGDAGCTESVGRTAVVLEGSSLCRVGQVAVSGGAVATGDGWYLDDFSADAADCEPSGMRIAYTDGRVALAGDFPRIDCAPDAYREIFLVGATCPHADARCEPGETLEGRLCVDSLECDGTTGLLRTPCGSDGECPLTGRCEDGYCAVEGCP